METSSYWSGQFFIVFHWSPWSLVNGQTSFDSVILYQDYRIKGGFTGHHQWATSYDSGILRQDYGIIQGLPMKHTRFADRVTIWVAHLPEWTETGKPNYRIGPDCVGSA